MNLTIRVLFTSLAMIQNNRHWFFILLSASILITCARPQSPTGGPRDETPPQLIQTTPEQRTLFFKGNEISLEFDEYITLDNIKKELAITPRVNDDYEYSFNKRTVTIKNLELEDSTTYTFNFGAGIVDITEKNPAQNVILVLSTGHYLDSLYINGNVTNILSGERTKNALLALYEIGDTLDIFSGRAAYAIKANEQGIFQFNNLKQGNYLLYAADDKNLNYQAEPDKEAYGFYPDTLRLKTGIMNLS